MIRRNKNFLIGLLCLIIFIIILTTILQQYVSQIVTQHWPFLILLFTVISVVVFFSTMKMKSKNDLGKFTNFYMGVTILKLVVYLATILIYTIVVPNNAKAFIFTFLIYYLCFSIFETYFLVKNKKDQ